MSIETKVLDDLFEFVLTREYAAGSKALRGLRDLVVDVLSRISQYETARVNWDGEWEDEWRELLAEVPELVRVKTILKPSGFEIDESFPGNVRQKLSFIDWVERAADYFSGLDGCGCLHLTNDELGQVMAAFKHGDANESMRGVLSLLTGYIPDWCRDDDDDNVIAADNPPVGCYVVNVVFDGDAIVVVNSDEERWDGDEDRQDYVFDERRFQHDAVGFALAVNHVVGLFAREGG